MKIAIDVRLWGIKHTGIGRYTENIVNQVVNSDSEDKFYLLARSGDIEEISQRFPRAQVVPADFPIYSFKEQILMPLLLWRIRPDIVHIPHFNIPVLWLGSMVVTIHDLITHDFRGKNQTTLSPFFYWIKYLVHLGVFKYAIVKSKAIIVPSGWAATRIMSTYHTDQKKLFVISESADPLYYQKSTDRTSNILKKYELIPPYIIYTGNAYEHKNLPRLIAAVKNTKVNLAIVCARSVFLKRVEDEIQRLRAVKQVKLLGRVSDHDLRELYRQSLAFITPSLSEGFGLTGLEAMAAGTIVLSSNATCLPEIYGSAANYFDPLNIAEMSQIINWALTLSPKQRSVRILEGIQQTKKYSWEKAASQTLKVYAYANTK